MAILVIVESPAKGKKIEQYLGNGYKVMATKGHIADLSKGGSYNLGVDIDNNFRPRYQILEDKKSLVEDLIEAAQEADSILIASDPDREGEAIAWHVASKLAKTGKDIKRVEFHEITKEGIAEGIKKVRDLDDHLFHAQEARRILDRIVGFMASPFLMNFFGPKLSAGRVQSVITKMVVDREQEIETFKPEPYFVIKARVAKEQKYPFWAKISSKVTDDKKADSIKNILLGNNCDTKFIVSKVEAKTEKANPPPPMITSQLQKIMSKDFGIKPDDTMKIAQSLYENGYVTYIRTDSVRSSPESIKAVRDYIKSQGYSLPKEANVFKTKDAAQDAHECIRPTDLSLNPDSAELSGNEKEVYDVIWKYFVASQMLPAVYNTLKVTLKVKDQEKCELKASGKALKSAGYLEILGNQDNSKIDIPDLNKDDELELFKLNPESVVCEKKFTQPPPRFTYYSLIDVLDKKGIGRPATYAEVLSKITGRNYVDLDGTAFKPTALGNKVTDTLNKSFSFMEYDYTANLEKKLDEIGHGKLDHVQMLSDFFLPFKEELNKAYISNGSVQCEKCQSPMKVKTTKTGEKFLGCSAFPNCYNTKSISEDKIVA